MQPMTQWWRFSLEPQNIMSQLEAFVWGHVISDLLHNYNRQTDEQETKRRSGSTNVTISLACKKGLIATIERNTARQTRPAARK
jgi:hypothetical protein